MTSKTYLGDGVYAEMAGDHVVLTTEDGIEVTNRIYLEPEVLAELVRYLHLEEVLAERVAQELAGGKR